MKLTWIALVAAMLQLSACAELSEREKLLNHCRKVDQDASKAMLDSDSSQFEMTAASGSRRTCVEPLLYLAADFRLRSQPEESQQILQEMFTLGRMTEAILNASREGTGSMESMLRYDRIANLMIRQVEIYLASDKDHARWQRIKSASGEIQNCAFTMQNGLANLDVRLYDEDVTLEAELLPWLCFSFRGNDYAILILDLPKSVNSDSRFLYLMRIRNGKMKIVEELPLLNAESWLIDDEELLIKGNQRYEEKPKKVSIKLNRL